MKQFDEELLIQYEQLYREIKRVCGKFSLDTREVDEAHDKVFRSWENLDFRAGAKVPASPPTISYLDVFNGQVPLDIERKV